MKYSNKQFNLQKVLNVLGNIYKNKKALEKELKNNVSDDIIYSEVFWMKNDMLIQEIQTINNTLINSVIIQNKYNKIN